MLFAKVVLGLPVEGPFDYIVPGRFSGIIKAGSRVRISFGPRKMIGYVVGLSRKTKIRKLKEIQDLLDQQPLLDKNMLALTRELANNYCCSWGEAIETALPESIRKGRNLGTVPLQRQGSALTGTVPVSKEQVELLQDIDGKARWEVYLNQVRDALNNMRSVLFIAADIESAKEAGEIIRANLGADPVFLYRSQPKEAQAWLSAKERKAGVVVGTRSSIFAPLRDLGLVIIDNEENSVYKQDQVPHYHAREIALRRVKLENAKLILGSSAPSLESMFLVSKNMIKYTPLPRQSNFPEIRLIDLKFRSAKESKRNSLFARQTEEAIYSALSENEKVLLFMNRKGFATFVSCNTCASVLKCERCSINLVYHFDSDELVCHYCNFKMKLPKICPKCNSGYIKFSGTGTQKLDSELHRFFPQARIHMLKDGEKADIKSADIFIATSSVIKQQGLNFGLIGVLGIDNSLNRADLRASEKSFAILSGLLCLTDKRMVIETRFPANHVFEALKNKDSQIFYENEFKTRKQLGFPPFKSMALVKLRGKVEGKVKEASHDLFGQLKECSKEQGIRVLSLNPGQPSKLRGNFYWQILLSANSTMKLSSFLKLNLKEFSRSGIIMTVDIDPM